MTQPQIMAQEIDNFLGGFPSLFTNRGTGYKPRISTDLGIPVPYNHF